MIYLISLIYTFCVGHKWNVLQTLLSFYILQYMYRLEDSSALLIQLVALMFICFL